MYPPPCWRCLLTSRVFVLLQSQEEVARLEQERQRLQEELQESNDKRESVAQWESQISEIIQW